MRRLLFAFVVTVAAMWALPSVAFAGETNCPVNDGKYEVDGGWEGTPAPGITVTAGTEGAINFTVASGTTLNSVCVKTGNGVNVDADWNISCSPDSTFPVDGPATCTVTSSGGEGAGLSHITFDVSTTPEQPPPPQPPPPGGGAGGTPPPPPPPGGPLASPPPPPGATGGALPFTGLPLLFPFLAGGLLLGAGLSLMRRGRKEGEL